MPRYAVLPGHEYKACVSFTFLSGVPELPYSCLLTPVIPYTNVFLEGEKRNPNHIVLKTQVVSLRPHHVTISETFPELGISTADIAFDFAIYALGAHLPAPLDLWGKDPRASVKASDAEPWGYNGFKTDGTSWLKERQKVIEGAPTVLVVGGGALGIRKYRLITPQSQLALSAYRCPFEQNSRQTSKLCIPKRG